MTVEAKFLFAEAGGQNGAYVLVDNTSAGIFLGLEGGQRVILVVCKERPPDPPNIAAIRVESRLRQDGDWALTLRLQREELKPLFSKLAEDLELTLRHRSGEPGRTVIARLIRWQRLLSPGASEVLGEAELRGLCGELAFLVNEAVPAVGARDAVLGWVGPYDAPKDFVFRLQLVEVKAVHSQSRTARVSSLEQLTDEGRPLFLWVQVVELVASSAGVTVAALVARAREAAANDAVAATELDSALLASGYVDHPDYSAVSVRFGRVQCFNVVGGFPRIQRTLTAPAIAACEYDLVLADLDPWSAQTWQESR